MELICFLFVMLVVVCMPGILIPLFIIGAIIVGILSLFTNRE